MRKIEKGFTLVELLVVIAIVAILAAVVVLIIDPLELTRRGRDATRLSDLSSLQQAINVTMQEEAGTTGLVCPAGTTVYPCTAKSNNTTDANNRKSDGTGWVRINLSGQPVSLSILPVDPTNSATLYYEYGGNASDQYELNAILESTQYSTKMTNSTGDGGDDDARYEVGSNLDIL
ncbi:MAG: hypothetical protein US86_C0005G0028 [Candidatus Daviesbacteria bacterium GW2011_GWA2_38_24]|uniref:Uncharacterized protein n=1 Tax=Candidatus Daviesbacteria bacterium GW2011_GWA2_38_24 TaxID=1618422 RepID=A0A0G0JI08_9BACT|nr:MAG: hypothetical protein US86_C0005G0028 [Candidatus Daviesbacteria bacterium GW2011_GWA2_38_24]KKQ78588.1 MAG: hypothetical protein UT01_C0065G0002 [Candidatus Daviesbacteria bacterium GW2011_GWA1_38_7]OGE24385.1 MAG: hypothetical protein A2688_02010 [Candidatus Daviesbacteria bacterium RIFCSPHIGHO2_01_FULL_38_8]